MSRVQLRAGRNLEPWGDASRENSWLSKWGAKCLNVLRTCGLNLMCLFMRIAIHLAFPRGKGEGKDILAP